MECPHFEGNTLYKHQPSTGFFNSINMKQGDTCEQRINAVHPSAETCIREEGIREEGILCVNFLLLRQLVGGACLAMYIIM